MVAERVYVFYGLRVTLEVMLSYHKKSEMLKQRVGCLRTFLCYKLVPEDDGHNNTSTFAASWPSTIAKVLYEKYKNQGFEILAFPCKQFAGQEPGSNEEIQDTIDVNGKNTAPVYKF
ncbi:hypothetical protein POTOM_054610 [Populus tomentosa]|uniref:Glutathione peroxidase n=1 Tax=Populus tomentosa TaxID=118781 RepID=A0A8X7XZJ3_POPTO|nr:hypothetical protein POTOM_054610 [Populus tomentosa]